LQHELHLSALARVVAGVETTAQNAVIDRHRSATGLFANAREILRDGHF
jgi:hypothetical protein